MENYDVLERKVPSSLEAERYVLGSMLLDHNLAIEIESSLDVNDFYYEQNQFIMSAIKELSTSRSEIGAMNVVEVLKRNGQFESIGGTDYIFDIINEVPVISEIDSYINILKEKSLQRNLLNAVKTINDNILSGRVEMNKLLEDAENSVMNIIKKRRTSTFMVMDRAVEKTFEIIESKVSNTEDDTKILTGYKELDEVTHGLGRGALIILAARPSIGKSTLALNIATNVAESGKKVAFFSLEMGYDQLVTKIFSCSSSINMDKIISGKLSDSEMAKLLFTKTKIAQYPIFFDDESTTELTDIKLKCQQLKRENQLDLLIIDYLQLLNSKDVAGQNRVQEVSKISRGLKVMARSLDIPIIALSQLSRSIETREDKTPVLADLRESGSIEQDADIVLFLHRDRPNKDENVKSYRTAKTNLIIAKNRNGETKTIKLIFNGANSKFSANIESMDEE